MQENIKLHVISHTHWDREWYQTFQGFRKRLVFMLDELIEHMEKNEDYKYFHMDGQTIVLEDYLEIRPQNEKKLKDLIKQGRIIIGPWYVMPDEFLISGESLVRNLQKGFNISRSFGVEPMKCGYVTDIFGHNSQMPQILNGFGIQSAMLFRGIADYPRDAFRWVAVDGSSVLSMKLDRERCYCNFYFAIRWPFDDREYEKEELVIRMKEFLKYSKEQAVSDNLLMMDGVDHMEIEPRLIEIIDILNENIEGIEMKQSTIEEYTSALANSGAELEEIKGELYNVGERGVSNQVLKNVLSSMVHLKQMNFECEYLLSRWAEPFDAAANYIKQQNNTGFIYEAWKYLLQNHPHDSICGCSITRVHKDNEYRFDQVKDIAQDVIDITFDHIASSINTGGRENNIVLFNGSQRDFNGIVEVELEFPAGSQGNFRIFDGNGNEIPYQLLEVRKKVIKRIFKFRRLPGFPEIDFYKVGFTAFIPSVGYSVYSYQEYKNILPSLGDFTFTEFHAPVRYPGTMQVGHRTWENEYLRVMIQENGALNVTNKATGKNYRDLMLFENCADVGDGWNYRKPAKDSRYVGLNGKTDFSVEYDGPQVVKWKIIHSMNLPKSMDKDGLERSSDKAEFVITTYVEMKKGSSRLEFNTLINNNIIEHRVRVLFPCYLKTDAFFTSTPFFLQERPIEKMDRSSHFEVETGVFPNQGIIILKDEKDCIGLYNKGLYEVEVAEDESHTIALTLFRSFKNEVGRGDKGEMSLMLRSMRFEYAFEFKSGNFPVSELMIEGETWKTGIKTMYTASHEGTLPPTTSFLKVNIPGAVLSCFKIGKSGLACTDEISVSDGPVSIGGLVYNDDITVVRLYNCTSEATQGDITLYKTPAKTYQLNLNEEVIGDMECCGNRIPVKMKPGQIMTIGLV